MSEEDLEEPIEGAEEPVETVLAADLPVFGDDKEPPEAAERNRALLRLYLDEIRGIRLLTTDEERELAHRVQAGDAEAERHLVEANLRLVVCLARRYVKRGLSLPDLVEEGNVGLLHAVRTFRPDRGARFATYAAWWIRQALVRALAQQARMIRLPVRVDLLLSQYGAVRAGLAEELGRVPTVAEVAARLGRPVEQVEDLETLRQEQPVRPAVPAGPASRLAGALGGRDDLAGVLHDLPDVERSVISLRFGLQGEEPMTLEAVGRRLGLPPEHVRQLEAAALKRLGSVLAARGVDLSDLA